MSKTLSASQIAPLFNWSTTRMHELAAKNEIPLIASESFRVFSHEDAYTYRDILMIEVARQMHDDGGIPMTTASKLVWNAGVEAREGDADYWIAVVRYRNTWGGSTDRGSLPVTEIGPGEYWSSAHFSGSFAEVSRSIADDIGNTAKDIPDCDPARIFMANVSTADRRLRKRAAELGIQIAGNDFA
jgi:hypothetical protein